MADRDVIFVVVDCLRYDHTTMAGYERDTTPFLAQLDAETYSNALATAPWTYPSVSSILTGQYPHNHRADSTDTLRSWTPIENLSVRGLSDESDALSELLEDAGYETWCQTAIKPVEMALGDRFGDVEYSHHESGDVLLDSFLDRWDETSDGSRFGYLHLGDAHGWDDGQTEDERAFPDHQPFGDLRRLPRPEEVDWDSDEEHEWFVDEFERIYDTGVRFADSIVERLFGRLSERGDLSETLVVVAGDHGEAFDEHVAIERDVLEYQHGPPYGLTHGRTLFQELLHVPLVVYDGGRTASIDDPVSTVDVVPTVLERLSVDVTPSHSLDGVLLPPETTDRPLFASGIGEGYEQRAVVEDGYKLIRQDETDTTLLFDLSTDPDETEPLPIDEHRAPVERLLDLLPAADEGGERLDVSEETERQLEALGYR
jgi:arylsulfatase A-like enzyme